jgi:hypothetical protein
MTHGDEPIIRGTRVPVRSITPSLSDNRAGNLHAVAQACGASRLLPRRLF